MDKEYIFKQIFNIMKESFPENELREYEPQKRVFNKTNYHYIISQETMANGGKYIENKEMQEDGRNGEKTETEGDIKGFLSFWSLCGFNFIEHVAVKKDYRGQGIGTELIRNYFKQNNLKTILEVETPTNSIKTKRIKFYEKLGFKLNFYFYSQPSLKKGLQGVPMYIMSYPEELNFREFINLREELYKNIYFA